MRSWLLAALALCFAVDAHAQAVGSADAGRPISIGVWLGGEAIPRSLDLFCGQVDGHEGGAGAGVQLNVPLGRFVIEGRSSLHIGTPRSCESDVIIPYDGIHSTRAPDVSDGALVTTDLRLGIGLGEDGRYVIALGPGWAWAKELPYLTSSFGIRAGDRVRGSVDFEVNTYRIPWDSLTANYRDGRVETVISARRNHEWATSFAVRVGIEIPITR